MTRHFDSGERVSSLRGKNARSIATLEKFTGALVRLTQLCQLAYLLKPPRPVDESDINDSSRE
jgi:hypothetical protein